MINRMVGGCEEEKEEGRWNEGEVGRFYVGAAKKMWLSVGVIHIDYRSERKGEREKV